MVLVFAILGCMSTKVPAPSEIKAVPTAVTLASPESGAQLTTPNEVMNALRDGFAKKGLALEPIKTNPPLAELGTRQHRTEWLLQQTSGSLAVMVETEARQRSQLGGRYQWEVVATVTIVSDESGVLVEQIKLPTTLPHIHLNESDALIAIGTRLAEKTTLLIERHQRSGT